MICALHTCNTFFLRSKSLSSQPESELMFSLCPSFIFVPCSNIPDSKPKPTQWPNPFFSTSSKSLPYIPSTCSVLVLLRKYPGNIQGSLPLYHLSLVSPFICSPFTVRVTASQCRFFHFLAHNPLWLPISRGIKTLIPRFGTLDHLQGDYNFPSLTFQPCSQLLYLICGHIFYISPQTQNAIIPLKASSLQLKCLSSLHVYFQVNFKVGVSIVLW